MRRKVKVRLTRKVGKRLLSKSVVVYQVTLGGFVEALRVAGEYVFRFRNEVKKGAPLIETEVVLALGHPNVCASMADVLCPDQPRAWYRPWHSTANLRRMLQAARQTSDWSRLVGELDFSGKKKPGQRRRRGTLVTDAVTLARVLGVSPAEIIDAWPMERFLDVCEALNIAAEDAQRSEDPTLDPDAEPTPLAAAAGWGGRVVVH